MPRVDDVVDDVRGCRGGCFFEAAADREIVAEEMKAFFELEVQGNIVGKTLGSGFAGELLLVGEEIERESGAGFERVGDFQLMDDRELEQREVSPGKETVGSIPAIWAWLLPAEDRAVDIKVEGLIGGGAGPSVGANQHGALAKVVGT